jgi:hypothetical protein
MDGFERVFRHEEKFEKMDEEKEGNVELSHSFCFSLFLPSDLFLILKLEMPLKSIGLFIGSLKLLKSTILVNKSFSIIHTKTDIHSLI